MILKSFRSRDPAEVTREYYEERYLGQIKHSVNELQTGTDLFRVRKDRWSRRRDPSPLYRKIEKQGRTTEAKETSDRQIERERAHEELKEDEEEERERALWRFVFVGRVSVRSSCSPTARRDSSAGTRFSVDEEREKAVRRRLRGACEARLGTDKARLPHGHRSLRHGIGG